ncbi:MAG: carboxypeptidase-like regulatory domain-containing protein, partial [Bacteroidota bacterium]
MKKLFIYILILGASSLAAQTVNRFQQAASDNSDYYINIDWEFNLSGGCQCVPAANTTLNISQNNGFGLQTILTLNGSSGNPWSGISQTTWHPGFGTTYQGNLFNNNATNNLPPGTCNFPCPYGVVSNVINASTQNLKNVNNLNVVRTDTGSALLTWDVVTDIPNWSYKLFVYKNGSLVNTLFDKSIEQYEDPCTEVGDTYSIRTRYEDAFLIYATSTGLSTVTMTQQIYDAVIPNGRIEGQVLTSTGDPVEGVSIVATLQNPGNISNGSCWPSSYSILTEANGTYTIPFIYWGEGTDQAIYKVTPMLAGRGFDPDFLNMTLRNGDFDKRNVNFTDTTSYTITGIINDANGCGVDSALIQTSS